MHEAAIHHIQTFTYVYPFQQFRIFFLFYAVQSTSNRLLYVSFMFSSFVSLIFTMTCAFHFIKNKKKKPKIHQIVLNFLESDNPGSTDSEVRKILTLHIPITEYDTLGSESDNDVSSRAVNSAKYRPQRGEYPQKK